jgi:putative transcriptional regulator
MTKDQIKSIRASMALSQADFGRLFGVHAMTVSRWERGQLRPTPYHVALMEQFRRAIKKRPTNVESEVAGLLVGAGVIAAIFFLLKAAHDSTD